ncbi:MAG: helix-turn-helix domain-containing protein [Candidatus Marinimicrobia bacterium]|nr:helix-turn-helix domain-containing protein [Candidatus Neomarinimicrobiota bacterium]
MTVSSNKYCTHCGANQERFLSVKSAAVIFDHSEDAIRAMIKRRDIPFYKRESRIYIKYGEFEELLIRYPSESEIILDNL